MVMMEDSGARKGIIITCVYNETNSSEGGLGMPMNT